MGPDRNLVFVLAVEIDQGDKGAALIVSDRAGLRHAGKFPSCGQQNRIAQAMDGAVEDQPRLPSYKWSMSEPVIRRWALCLSSVIGTSKVTVIAFPSFAGTNARAVSRSITFRSSSAR